MVPVGDILILDSTNKGACSWVLMGVWRNGLEGVKRERMIRRVDVRREKTRGRNQFLFFCCALVVLPSISAVQEIFREKKEKRESAMKWVDERERVSRVLAEDMERCGGAVVYHRSTSLSIKRKKGKKNLVMGTNL